MSRQPSFVAVLRARAAAAPEGIACRFLEDGLRPRELTYSALDAAARAIAGRLQGERPQPCPGERAVLLYPPGLDYVAAFFGCLYAGVIAVPAYPPLGAAHQPRLSALIEAAQPAFILAAGGIADSIPELGSRELRWIVTDGPQPPPRDGWIPPAVGPDTVAFLQYTSGTTGHPKGVIISHGNLLNNSEFIRRRFGHSEDSSGVIWLPPYHDMGLIGGILQPVYAGFPVTLLSPLDFLRDPALWLRAVTSYSATTSGGPNFAFDLCARRITPQQRESLDLSSWQVAFTGSEAVNEATMRAFTKAFRPTGFRQSAFYPCYGLAEATLMATGGSRTRPAITATFDAEKLGQGTACRSDLPGGRRLTGCGRPAPDHDLRIVDPSTDREVPDGTVGEIWVRGPSVSAGYWRAARDERGRLAGQADDARYLRTGDLGFRHGGELFVTSRIKDIIVIRGRNYAPEDIERAVAGCDPRLRRGVAFSVEHPGGERLFIAQEVAAGPDLTGPDAAALARAIRTAVVGSYGLAVQGVALLAKGSLPKTLNGKLQRSRCRADLLSGALTPIFADDLDGDAAQAGQAARDVRSIAARLLRVPREQLDAETALTSFGLDSVTAVELAARLEHDGGLRMPPGRLVDVLLGGASCATVADCAVRTAPVLADPVPAGSAVSAAPGDEDSQGALTSNERAIWFLQQLAPGSRAYHLCHAVDISGPLAHESLARAIDRLAARHPALRTTFRVRAGEPARVTDGPSPQLDLVDASGWGDADIDADIQAFSALPIDLTNGPLWRFRHYVGPAGRHTLAFATHHIAADLWSLAVVARELTAYLSSDDGPHVASAGMSVAVRLERQYLGSARAEADARAWLDRQADAPPVTSLHGDRRRPAVQSHRGACHQIDFGESATVAVHELARDLHVTPYAVLLGSLYWILNRYTGADDLVVGAPMPGRTDRVTHDLVGMCVNTLPVRCRVKGSQSFREVVTAAAAGVRGALAVQQYPFAKLVELAQPERDASRTPLFQIVLALQQAPGHSQLGAFAGGVGQLRVGELTVMARPLPVTSAPFELTLEVAEHAGSLRCAVRYQRDLWEQETIECFAEHWLTLLAHACADPGVRSADVPLEAAPRRRGSLAGRLTGRVKATGLHDALAAWSRRTPGAVAIADQRTQLSFAELEAAAAGVTRRLRELGTGQGSITAILISRSASFVVAAVGTLRAGAAYLPLDLAHPPARLAAQLRDASPRLILTDGAPPVLSEITALLGSDVPPRLDLAACGLAEPGIGHRVRPHELAYVMYTSGTTGAPKGVCVPHVGAVNLLEEMAARAPLPRGAACSWWTPTTFDVSVYEIFSAMQAGGRLLAVPEKAHADATALAGWLDRQRIASAYVPPFALDALAEHAEGALAGGAPMALRRLLVGVEPIPGVLLHRIAAAVPGLRIINGYGPTEATICATLFDVGDGGIGDSPVPIGTGIRNAAVYLLDRHGSEVPTGVPGEVYVGGAGVTRGYLGQAAATAELYLPDPRNPGGRMYRTGDIARRGRDGQLRFLGRRDRQVKVRGVRVELSEVEAALRADGRVRSAVAIIRHVGGRPALVGYAVTGAAGPGPAELLARMRSLVPAAMVPEAIVRLDALPVTRNGKLDFAALPPPAIDQQVYEPPRGAVEQAVAAIWSQLLGGCRVGRNDDFFCLGGHSLLAARGALELGARLDREVPVAMIFVNPSAAALAAALAAEPAPAEDAPLVALPRAGEDRQQLRDKVLTLPEDIVARLLADQGTEAR